VSAAAMSCSYFLETVFGSLNPLHMLVYKEYRLRDYIREFSLFMVFLILLLVYSATEAVRIASLGPLQNRQIVAVTPPSSESVLWLTAWQSGGRISWDYRNTDCAGVLGPAHIRFNLTLANNSPYTRVDFPLCSRGGANGVTVIYSNGSSFPSAPLTSAPD
jgi:hypothetical protein